MSLLREWESRNLSDREAYTKFGYLSPDRMERLIDLAERADRLREIAKNAKPQELLHIAASLEQIQEELEAATEYGREVIYDHT